MTSQHTTRRLRVGIPTLEPDPVFLGMLADLSASSRPAAPRTTRSAGLRLIAATASVATIVAATWAAGIQTSVETPLPSAGSPAQEDMSGPSSHGDTGSPQSGVSTSPGSPTSPGLPGTNTSDAEQAVDPATAAPRGGVSAKVRKDRGPQPRPRAQKLRGPKSEATPVSIPKADKPPAPTSTPKNPGHGKKAGKKGRGASPQPHGSKGKGKGGARDPFDWTKPGGYAKKRASRNR